MYQTVFIQVLNMFIIVKITKSAKFRSQFRRHDDEDGEPAEVRELRNGIQEDVSNQGIMLES